MEKGLKGLKNLRLSKRLSQRQLGEMVGLSRMAIGGMETGKLDPSVQTLRMLCKLFQTSADCLLNGKIDTQPKAPAVFDIRLTVPHNSNGSPTVELIPNSNRSLIQEPEQDTPTGLAEETEADLTE